MDAAVVVPEQLDVAGTSDLGVNGHVQVLGKVDPDLAHAHAYLDLTAVECLEVADVGEVDDQLTGVEPVLVLDVLRGPGRVGLLAAVPVLGDGRAGQDQGGQDAEQDQATGASPEGAKEQQRGDDAECQRGVRRVGDVQPGQ